MKSNEAFKVWLKAYTDNYKSTGLMRGYTFAEQAWMACDNYHSQSLMEGSSENNTVDSKIFEYFEKVVDIQEEKIRELETINNQVKDLLKKLSDTSGLDENAKYIISEAVRNMEEE